MGCLICCTTALIISLSLLYAYAKYRLSYWSRRGVKSPPTHVLFGNFKDCITLKKSPSDVMREIYNSVDPDEPYVGFYIFHKPMLLMRDRELIKQMMIKDFDVFPNRRFGSGSERDSVGLDSILSMKQPRWRYVRTKLTPVLTGQKLKAMIPLMLECGKFMTDFIEKLPVDETGRSKWEVKDIGGRYSTNVLASLAFGVNINSFDEKETAFWKNGTTIFNGFMRGIVFIILFFIPDWDFLVAPIIKKPANYLRKIFWESMNAREKLELERGDMIDSMLALKNGEQNPLYKFEDDNLLAHPTSFYIAGFEASATALAFTLYNLARHPEHQDTLYNAIQTELSGKEFTEDLINKLPFLDSVITESLRLHPPLPVIDRIATRNYELPDTGLTIEKGVSVYISINAFNQDPKYFSDPQNFIPLRAKMEDKKFYENLAFGIGPRSCIGQRLAMLIEKIALIAIVSNYTMSLLPREENTLNNSAIHVFTYVVDGLHVRFEKRN
ncbi:PREDICTED: cytochrome P450 6k1-like [Vollenhovia emeryi]|uniref:cytochrome P450 6k1-like n=1 Tax=Vollenhovia emeryi TaxID=411798 RepID=UPI0005F4C289|nr:PREDICTED: cytochrome P450 6k1-like [Vollenhovia emeryi]XP_011868124.1 PREDICTED: cytochrome P450 6k1-like [Vollenhovia emeryi]XP_011868125.1 PREDICTED: cytochrome P450 6k1-like [Vollenhovia emeryi]XP_011868126.1 PREDICTED: cytochrome P450 6k1-like [Vollenhovia emeryi]XP_011868127.1 PREDICTED: cytochrome P450 6k1-like [Vollenhovia emeryi]